MPLPTIRLPLGEWLPDLGGVDNPGLVEVSNALPTINGYRSVRGFSRLTSSTGTTNRALAMHWNRLNDTHVFTGDETALYALRAGSWADVTGVTSLTGVSRWSFDNFGPYVIAVSKGNTPLYYDIRVPQEVFHPFPADAPIWATTAATIRDFVVMGNLGGDEFGENFIRWSGFNNFQSWEPSAITQSDYQPMSGNGGAIQTIVGGTVGYIFRQNSISSLTYVGPPVIFRLDEVGANRGTPAPESVIKLGPMIYYYDHEGFYSLNIQSGEFTNIGDNKVNSYFAERVPFSCVTSMKAIKYPDEPIILWIYCTEVAATVYNEILAYDYALGKWSKLNVGLETLHSVPEIGYNLDTLDQPFPQGIDLQSIPTETDAYVGGGYHLYGFDSTHGPVIQGGDYLESSFTTSLITPPYTNMRMLTDKQIPIIDRSATSSMTTQVLSKDYLSPSLDITAPYMADSEGRTYIKRRGNYLGFKVNVNGQYTNFTGLEVTLNGYNRANT